MSYILDALKKSQHARQLGQVPTIETSQPDAEPQPGAPTRWIYSAVGLALVAIIVAAYGILDKRTSRAPAVAHVQSPVRPIAGQAGAPSATNPTPRSSQASELGASSKASDTLAAEIDLDTSNLEAGPVPFELFGAEAPTPSPTTSPMQFSEMALGMAAEHEETSTVPITEVDTTIPLLRQLSPEFRQTVPPMSLDVHVYRESPARRFVLINETLYRQGEHTSEGPVVEEIAPDCVILIYRGRLFRLGT